MNNEVALFEQKEIRRTWQDEKWYFSIVDVCGALSDSENPKRYWSDLKRKLLAEGANQTYEKIVRLKMLASDGRMRRHGTAFAHHSIDSVTEGGAV